MFQAKSTPHSGEHAVPPGLKMEGEGELTRLHTCRPSGTQESLFVWISVSIPKNYDMLSFWQQRFSVECLHDSHRFNLI